jgi:hypothetical protein
LKIFHVNCVLVSCSIISSFYFPRAPRNPKKKKKKKRRTGLQSAETEKGSLHTMMREGRKRNCRNQAGGRIEWLHSEPKPLRAHQPGPPAFASRRMMIHDEPRLRPWRQKPAPSYHTPASPQQSPRPRVRAAPSWLASEPERTGDPIGIGSRQLCAVSRGYNGAAPALPARQ